MKEKGNDTMDEYLFFNLKGLTIGTLHMMGQDLGIKPINGEDYEDTVYHALSLDYNLDRMIEVLREADLDVVCMKE